MASLYIYDGTGNPTALITTDAYESLAYKYDPYGVPTLTEDSGDGGQLQNPYLFKQGTQDRTTGWVKYGARYYNPTIGRWSQQDTLDTPLNPANANRYAYAANNPLNLSDPTGLYSAGEVVKDCAFGATTSTAIAVGLGSVTGGVGLGVTLLAGCTGNVLTGVTADLLTNNSASEGQVNGGLIYMEFLGDLAQIGQAIF